MSKQHSVYELTPDEVQAIRTLFRTGSGHLCVHKKSYAGKRGSSVLKYHADLVPKPRQRKSFEMEDGE